MGKLIFRHRLRGRAYCKIPHSSELFPVVLEAPVKCENLECRGDGSRNPDPGVEPIVRSVFY